MSQHGYTVRSNPFFIVHRRKPDLCYFQCIDTMLVRSDSTEGYFVLMFGIKKSFIISLMIEFFLGWYSLSFAYSMLRISDIITCLKNLNSAIIAPLHSSLNKPGFFLFTLIFSSPK